VGDLTRGQGFLVATSFLTRVPVRSMDAGPERGIPWFPVVGAVVGLAIGAVYSLAHEVLAPSLAASLAVTCGAIVTGGFHEDGLADTADAFGGGWDRDDVLRILKDPRQGTFGVLALVMSSVLKIGAISTLGPWAALITLTGAHAFSRSAAIAMLGWAPAANEQGLGAAYAAGVSRRQIWLTACIGVVLTSVLLGVFLAPAALASCVLLFAITRMAMKKVGGVTGDVLGAAQQIVEICVLLGVSAVVTNGWGTIPWWEA
jgi:adenosylcobinamide-GDP ribazoletransferase